MKMTKNEAFAILREYGDHNGMYDYQRLEHIPDLERLSIMSRLRLARQTIEDENRKFKNMADSMVHVLAGMTTVVAFALFSQQGMNKDKDYYNKHRDERLVSYGLSFALGSIASYIINKKDENEE